MRPRFAAAVTAGLCAIALVGCGGGSATPSSSPAAASPVPVAAASTTPASSATPRAAGLDVTLRDVRLVLGAGTRATPFDQPRSLTLPSGWKAQVWARVPAARFETFTPQGSLLVAQVNRGTITELVPRAGASPRQRILLSGLANPQGMAFDVVDGKRVLYVAESGRVDRYAWTDAGTPGARATLVDHLPDEDAAGDDVHRQKSLAVGPDHTIYVTIASSTNAGVADATKQPYARGTILAMRPDGGDARVFARGIRNGEGLSFDPDGRLWTAVNNRDNIAYPYDKAYGSDDDAFGKVIQAYVNDHAPEELAKLTPGRDLGWPSCNPDADTDPGSTTTGFDYATPRFVPDAQTNGHGKRRDCSKLTPIERGLPAHSAPLGLHFVSSLTTGWGQGALLAVHGSWNRRPPRAPGVVWLPWSAGDHTLGAPVALVGGFQGADGNRWGRPVDAITGPDHALYVSDDAAGAVYRITIPRR